MSLFAIYQKMINGKQVFAVVNEETKEVVCICDKSEFAMLIGNLLETKLNTPRFSTYNPNPFDFTK